MTKKATLTNLDRAEYGTVNVDLGLLRKQIKWLAGPYWQLPKEFKPEGVALSQGILNLLEGILDLTDPPGGK